ncbi:hypothetical protein OWR29_46100 [Actinoplanes sp. Pm04-4]|jgi:hypothetical protein|uniref:Uncharacterized protein n=1 Tax=Paractinoplanes pyxinae TaxID=2997416 RepID=A0ABT4BHG1_9ACTN|nr:hypothetical protein [Actinoplanes pyxinae]MCY1145422.1 hypothetical protein [Actinoplanes pyxinae]
MPRATVSLRLDFDDAAPPAPNLVVRNTSPLKKEFIVEIREETVAPLGDAGLFDIDPDQTGVVQDPAVEMTGDVDALEEDWEF